MDCGLEAAAGEERRRRKRLSGCYRRNGIFLQRKKGTRRMQRHTLYYGLMVVLLTAVAFAPAAAQEKTQKVTLRMEKYDADLCEAVTGYKGKPLVLGEFTNSAQTVNETEFMSADRNIRYVSSDPLNEFFWYCFKEALHQAEFKQRDCADCPEGESPVMTMNLLSIDDARISLQVVVTISGTKYFEKTFEITNDTAARPDKKKDIRDWFFGLFDKIICTVFGDADLKQVLAGN
jgi:hypothetical protein